MILRFFGQLSANVVHTFSISDQANSSPYCKNKFHDQLNISISISKPFLFMCAHDPLAVSP